jgi:hypothetical protein
MPGQGGLRGLLVCCNEAEALLRIERVEEQKADNPLNIAASQILDVSTGENGENEVWLRFEFLRDSL